MAWVRSQNKKDLVETSHIQLSEAYQMPDCQIIGYLTHSPNETYVVVGSFSNKTAALAELDAIERWIELGISGIYQIGSDPDA